MAGWTDERIERLRKLWNDGLSAAQCAAELGDGLTRNAVIGKVTRLGISVRAKSAQPVAKPKPVTGPPTQPRVVENVALALAPLAEPVETIAIPVSGRVTLFDLQDNMCRWPFGTVGADDFHFCGATGASFSAGRSYCAKHSAAAQSREFTKLERQEYLAKKKALQAKRGRQ